MMEAVWGQKNFWLSNTRVKTVKVENTKMWRVKLRRCVKVRRKSTGVVCLASPCFWALTTHSRWLNKVTSNEESIKRETNLTHCSYCDSKLWLLWSPLSLNCCPAWKEDENEYLAANLRTKKVLRYCLRPLLTPSSLTSRSYFHVCQEKYKVMMH